MVTRIVLKMRRKEKYMVSGADCARAGVRAARR
jgi:hypothetical protein